MVVGGGIGMVYKGRRAGRSSELQHIMRTLISFFNFALPIEQ
jgi:hypothetical protein